MSQSLNDVFSDSFVMKHARVCWRHLFWSNSYVIQVRSAMFVTLFMSPLLLDAPLQPAVSIKEEVTSIAGSEHGEEEMEVDSADEQEEEVRSQGGQAHSQVSRSNNTGATFNTLSSLGSLRPGIMHIHLNACSVL